MKAIHVGLGGFGIGWPRLINGRNDVELIAAVDRNEATFEKVKEFNVPCFKNLEDAFKAVGKPDFIINATPPGVHLAVNRLAFSYFDSPIPVLMEKPIAENFADIREMLEHAKNGQKIMVAENYRYTTANVFAKKEIQSRLRNISAINMVFRQHHHMPDTNYHAHMEHPAMIDIGVHHIDLLRFFTGMEVHRVYAQLAKPAWSWYRGLSNVKMLAEMDNSVQFCYDCSMDSYAKTNWYGNWTFTAENGVARYFGDKLIFNMEDGDIELDVPKNVPSGDKTGIMDEFLAYLQSDILPQTSLADQAKNAAVVEAGIQAAEQVRCIDVENI